MLNFLKKLFRPRKPVIKEELDPDQIVYERWSLDFSQPENIRFDIKSESSYSANREGDSLALHLHKTSCLAWVKNPLYRYRDVAITCRIRLLVHGGYGAAGIMFRILEEGSSYSVMVSSKGYFRLDAYRNGNPQTLAGWTEISPPPEDDAFDLDIVAYGNHLVAAVNSRRVAEIHDAAIPLGNIGFVCASYEGQAEEPYAAEAFLESFSLESRIQEVEQAYTRWTSDAAGDPQSHIHLAETFTAMGQYAPALIQLKKAWEREGYVKTQGELLLACRLASGLNQLEEAEEYSAAAIALGTASPEGQEALVERAKILYLSHRFKELAKFGKTAMKGALNDSILQTLLGHAFWELGEYEKAAELYDAAFERDNDNGLAAKNGANAYELLGDPEKALDRYMKAGRAFLSGDNYGDLGSITPKLLSLGGKDWEAHGLTGKWAFGIENWKIAEDEFNLAEKLRKKTPGKPPEDPAILFLQAHLLIREGKRREALPLLKKAAALEPDYPLFRFKLAENRLFLSGDPQDKAMLADLDAALKLAPDDGWIVNFAAQVALSRGELEEADSYLERASQSLGDIPAIKVNRGVMYYLRGSLDQGLKILEASKWEDPEGIMANCAGNLLVRAKKFEEADERYVAALGIAPGNPEFLLNRASCLIELNRFGEADEVLSQAHTIEESPAVLELIAFVAAKKGEYQRAEAACRAALEINPRHAHSLLTLGWILVNKFRWKEAEEVIRALEGLSLSGDTAKGLEDLRARVEEALYRVISCGDCGRSWKVSRSPMIAKALRLFAEPPDDLPGGTCPRCGATYCVGCAKKSLDSRGRFLCQNCQEPLKLMDEGLKKIIIDWAEGAIKNPRQPTEPSAEPQGASKTTTKPAGQSKDNAPPPKSRKAVKPDSPRQAASEKAPKTTANPAEQAKVDTLPQKSRKAVKLNAPQQAASKRAPKTTANPAEQAKVDTLPPKTRKSRAGDDAS